MADSVLIMCVKALTFVKILKRVRRFYVLALFARVIELQRKPIEGIGDPPMLRNGYANAKFEFSFWNLTLLSSWLCSEVCDIVGIDVPKTLPTASVAVPNATAADSSSVAEAVSFWNAVSEALWVICGNPQDIGISDAPAWSDSMAITVLNRIAVIIILFIVFTLLNKMGYK
jgi:hypothetical protein